MAERARFSLGSLRRVEFVVVAILVLFIAIMAGLSIVAGFDQVWAHVRRIDARLLLLMLGLSTVNYLLRAWRWQHFGDGLGVPLPWSRNLLYFVAGFALTVTPGKMGEGLRLWLIERCHGHPYERSAPIFVGDRLSDMTAILLLCLAGVGAFTAYAAVTAGIAVVVVLACLPLMRPALLLRASKGLYALCGRRAPRLFARIRTAIRSTARLFTFRLFGLGLIAALLGWFAEIVAFHQLLQHLGAGLSLQQAMFIFTFGMMASTVVIVGGTEAVMLALLAALGVDFQTAVAATGVIRLATLWYAVGLGFVALPFALRLARRGRDAAVAIKPQPLGSAR